MIRRRGGATTSQCVSTVLPSSSFTSPSSSSSLLSPSSPATPPPRDLPGSVLTLLLLAPESPESLWQYQSMCAVSSGEFSKPMLNVTSQFRRQQSRGSKRPAFQRSQMSEMLIHIPLGDRLHEGFFFLRR